MLINFLEKIDKKIATVLKFFSSFVLLIMLIIISSSIITRYFLNFNFQWVQEIIGLLFVYLIFLAIPIAFKTDEHIKITFFQSLFPDKVRKGIEIFNLIVITFVLISIVLSSVGLIQKVGGTPLTISKIPRGSILIMFPIGFIISLFYIFLNKLKKIKMNKFYLETNNNERDEN